MSRPTVIERMVDETCGITPGAAPVRPRLLRKGDIDADTAALLALADGAKAWWEMRRPPGWTVEQHLNHPTVCQPFSEHALSEAVAELVRRGW